MLFTRMRRFSITNMGFGPFNFSKSRAKRRKILCGLLLVFAAAFILHSIAIITRHWFELEAQSVHIGLWAVCNYTIPDIRLDNCDYQFDVEYKVYIIASLNVHCISWMIEALGLFFATYKVFYYEDGEEDVSVPGLAVASLIGIVGISAGHSLLLYADEGRKYGWSYYVGIASGATFVLSSIICFITWKLWHLRPLKNIMTNTKDKNEEDVQEKDPKDCYGSGQDHMPRQESVESYEDHQEGIPRQDSLDSYGDHDEYY